MAGTVYYRDVDIKWLLCKKQKSKCSGVDIGMVAMVGGRGEEGGGGLLVQQLRQGPRQVPATWRTALQRVAR
jgi:hypothetical protein